VSKVNVPFAILSLATSVLLWASVYNDRNDKPTEKKFNPTLTIRNLQDKKFVITQMPDFVTLPLSGYQRDFRAISEQGTSAIVDMSKPKIGSSDYPVIIFPSAVRELLGNNTISVRLKVDLLETKRVDVVIEKTGQLPSGYHEASVEESARWLYITGPSELVQRVAQVTVPLNISSPVSVERDIEPKIVDDKGNVIPNVMLSETEVHDDYRYNLIQNSVKIHVSLKIEPDVVVPTKK
jgi:YbbR domain-containing protein